MNEEIRRLVEKGEALGRIGIALANGGGRVSATAIFSPDGPAVEQYRRHIGQLVASGEFSDARLRKMQLEAGAAMSKLLQQERGAA